MSVARHLLLLVCAGHFPGASACGLFGRDLCVQVFLARIFYPTLAFPWLARDAWPEMPFVQPGALAQLGLLNHH